MDRSTADAPRFGAAFSDGEKQVSQRCLSLEVQLWIVVGLLMVYGLVMIFSASSILALKKFSDPAFYMKRQLLCMGLGICAIITASRFSYRRYMKLAPLMLLGVMVLLILVLIPGLGVEVNNARRWFRMGGFQLQPAEYAKVVWVIYLSMSLIKKAERVRDFRIGFLPHIILCGFIAMLLLKEPDFGTTFMIGCLAVIMMALGGVPLRHLLLLAPVATAALYFLVYLVPYRWERITAFRDPWTDPLDSGYQLIQAWIAVGSGGLFGKGLGAGQQKLFYLPESYTDFILAVIGEEWGFAGIFAVCILFYAFFKVGLRIAREAPDFLGALLATGLTLMLAIQALLNMSVVLGLVPTKGLPLPFISYGGSAFIANCLAVGVLMNIARSGVKQTE